jgi:1-deoxy-D-xylulose-5-phosphate reductoisomerase
MTKRVANVAVWGSTGSVGRNTLEVVEANSDRLKVVALSAHSNVAEAVRQAQRLKPRWVVATDLKEADSPAWRALPRETKLLVGAEHVETLSACDEVDVVVSAIVGSAGLRGNWAALEAGKRVALANKETLVVAGPLIMDLVRRSNAEIVPVDSEHSAIFQSLSAGRAGEVRRVILTASGGPFRQSTPEELARVTVADALDHPTWEMGPKISVDSATMMNKALEIIEARWLFGLQADQIEVVVHPQSIVHSMVEFVDGSIVGQMSPPDMKLPIQYALSHPHRWPGPAAKLDWSRVARLDFEPPDPVRFPALELGREVARSGGTAGAVLNAANEAAVQRFLEGDLPFTDIVPVCRSILKHHHFDAQPTLEQLLQLDRWARQEVSKWTYA